MHRGISARAAQPQVLHGDVPPEEQRERCRRVRRGLQPQDREALHVQRLRSAKRGRRVTDHAHARPV